MSLLLDALKKAAKDKQSADSAAVPQHGGQPDGGNRDADYPAQPDEITVSRRPAGAFHEEPLEELELPEDQGTGADEGVSWNASTVTATPSTVTDDALQLLIHRTNKEYSRSRLTLWGSVVAGVILTVLLGGVYFYMDMSSEIQSIERKHRNELAALQSKTRIEENLTSLAAEVRNDNQPAVTGTSAKAEPAATRVQKSDPVDRESQAVSASAYHVEKSQKEDPLSLLLNRGWRAYQHQDYQTAREAYSEVLQRESNNQDAMLGLAAVAVRQQDYEQARTQYVRLLELDPRDPQAHAGLATIAQMSGGSLSKSRLKELIDYNPHDATLQFTLGNLYVEEEDWPSAQSAYFRAWQNDSLNPDYAFNLAVSLDQIGKQQEAARYYRESIRLAEGKNIGFSTAAARQRLQQIQGKRQ